MDGLTHAIFPFLAGKYFGRSRTECAALLLGGIAPDSDIFLSWIPLFFQTTLPLYHRGITHTLIFGFVTAAIVLFIASRKYFQDLLAYAFRTNIKLTFIPGLLVLAYVGVLSHLFLDWLTTFGIPLLYPFIASRFSAELFFYIDVTLLTVSMALLIYAVFNRSRMILSIHNDRKNNSHKYHNPHTLEDSSPGMNGHYSKMFVVLFLVLIILIGLRYYEKGVSSDYFNISAENIFPSFASPFEWRVVDTTAGKLYEFDSLEKIVISESSFTGINPNRFRYSSDD